MRRATYKMADTLSSIWKHVANDTTISRLYSLYTAIRKLVYFNTDNVDWLLSLSQLNDVPGGGGSRNKQCLNTTRNCLLLTWRPRFNCISVGQNTRCIPVCLYRKQKKITVRRLPLPSPSRPCRRSDSDHVGERYALGRNRVSIETRELRLSTGECDYLGINIPNDKQEKHNKHPENACIFQFYIANM